MVNNYGGNDDNYDNNQRKIFLFIKFIYFYLFKKKIV